MPKKFIYHNEVGRICSDCTGFTPWDDFYEANNGFKGKQSYCKLCAKKRVYKRLGRNYELRELDKILNSYSGPNTNTP